MDKSPYRPYGAALALMDSQATELFISGAAGTGKSVAALHKLHTIANAIPGFRALILRKTRSSLTESALVTFEQIVAPGHACLDGASRMNRWSYRYPNGSELVCGGLDKASRIMSTEFDLIYVQEAIELDEPEWDQLLSRIGRRTVLPYAQMIADTNPANPQHWIKRRCDDGRAIMLQSEHVDNPLLFDDEKEKWTEVGVRYMANLDRLTGVWRDRLRDGKWVQAEGAVYPDWAASKHLIDRFKPDRHWQLFLSVDFGYVNPFVCQFWIEDYDGRLYLWKEIYHTNRLVEDHAKQIKAELEGWEPAAVVCDHDAEDRATLERHLGYGTTAATKNVSEGIQEVATRLRVHEDGRPRVLLMRDALAERDRQLHDHKLPCCLAEEIEGYVWDKAKGKDQPVKANDHGCDALRYMCMDRQSSVEWLPSTADVADYSEVAAAPEGVFAR